MVRNYNNVRVQSTKALVGETSDDMKEISKILLLLLTTYVNRNVEINLF